MFNVKIRTRAELLKMRSEADKAGVACPAWGWWADVSPGQSMVLREATPEDLDRCLGSFSAGESPADWLCELGARGAIVHRTAVVSLTKA